ncbi:hypothetical protein [Okeania sp. SIO3B5]|nr:hypothetical protein [Okeania sp. SIO3B5]
MKHGFYNFYGKRSLFFVVQTNLLKLSKNFWSNYLNTQSISEPRI